MLSNLRIQKLTHLFKLHDEDGSGFVEAADYERLIERFEARRTPDERLRELWLRQWKSLSAAQDPLGSGQVPLRGWLSVWNAILAKEFNEKVMQLTEHLFEGMDSDGDGQITADENRDWFDVLGLDQAQSQAVFATCDLDGDGHISKEEWKKLVNEFFYSDDPDAPGNVVFGLIDGISK